MTAAFDAFFADLTQRLGADAVNRSAETLQRYGENTLPGGDRCPAAVVYPRATKDVQEIVGAANRHRVPLYPISTGHNIGIGSRAAPAAGMVVVDLGRHMNRILEIDETLGFAVLEPGVTFQALADELARRGGKFMLSATSGPPQGGIVGNALDKGGGYGPYFDHFGMSCGMEVVLGTGAVIRTGDGSLDHADLPNWHVSKYSFGPILDGLFAQSNYGIVTRLGMWLMPRPPAIRSFHFAFADDDDLARIVDLARPLKLSNFVPTLFRIANDLYLCGAETASPEYALSGGRRAISDTGRKALQAKYGLGAWTVSGAFYGPSMAALEPQIERVRQHFTAAGGRYIPHEQALDMPALRIAIDAFSGHPGVGELGLLKWRPGGGNSWFTPGTPLVGATAGALHRLARGLYEAHGLDYMTMWVAGGRFARGLHVIAFNREDSDENRRADRCYRDLAEAFARRGISVGRAPIDYFDQHMAALMPEFRDACRAIKRALDPNGVIAPGRYGVM